MLPLHLTGLGSTKTGNSIFSHHCLSLTEKPTRSSGMRRYFYKSKSSPRNFCCKARRCKTCPILVTTDMFARSSTGQCFKLKLRTSCKTTKVNYLIQCRRCGLQYVGETGQPLHSQMNSYRFNIARGRINDSPVAAHFTSEGHTKAELSVIKIDRCCKKDTILRKIRESRWIKTLKTFCPSGMIQRTDGL